LPIKRKKATPAAITLREKQLYGVFKLQDETSKQQQQQQQQQLLATVAAAIVATSSCSSSSSNCCRSVDVFNCKYGKSNTMQTTLSHKNGNASTRPTANNNSQ